ncbi:MAG: competence/damage-inducible protein A [Actinomycetes bacterium]
MRVETLAVGTELLLGDMVNGNAAWLGQELAAHGFDVVAGAVVGDNVNRIAEFISAALRRSDAVVITGGLGPTQDDVTREAIAAVSGVELERHQDLVDQLVERARGLGRDLPLRNLQQADVPVGAVVLPNARGTAPGLKVDTSDGVIYALPGVPHEMTAMFTDEVLPDLARRSGAGAAIVSRVLRTIGLWESAIAELLADLDTRLGERRGQDPTAPTLAYLAGGGEVRVRITAKAPTRNEADGAIAPVEAVVRERLGAAVYGADDDTIERVVHALLQARAETVAVAESLTGGLLAGRLTSMPGASLSFRGGVTAYATDLKSDLLGVDPARLEQVGAVAADTAQGMAAGVRQRLGATYGLALTGVAGPTQQEGKPPGLVYAALATPASAVVRELRLPGDRDQVRQLAVVAALDLLRRHLTGVLPEPTEQPG